MGTPQQQYAVPGAQLAPAPPPVVITPELLAAFGEPGAELASMLDRLEAAKARVTEAEQARDQLIADIKSRGAAMATWLNGGQLPEHIRFAATPGRLPWDLDWKRSRKFNRDRFDRENPGVYERYMDPKGGWVLGPGG